MLAVDAFSDDSVPMHLLTREAVLGFMKRVGDNGILAMHTSNRYLDLGSILIRIAEESGIPVVYVNDDGQDEGASSSTWILLSMNKDLIMGPEIAGVKAEPAAGTPLWSDEHINIFPILYHPINPIEWVSAFFNKNKEGSSN